MPLSVLNKNFLALLNRLDIDVKQFPDKTFDGLFDNVPEVTNYFFNWLIENITPDNALTQAEQATYFQLESSQALPLDEEMNYVLSSCTPDFKQLMSLDINYVNNFLPQDLEDLTKNYKELSQIFTDIGTNHGEIKKKQNNLKEGIIRRKRQLGIIKEKYHSSNLLFKSKIDDVKIFLLKEPHFSISLDSYNNLLETEESIFNSFKTCKLLANKILNSSKLDILPELEDDMACIDISLILSEGFLRERKAKVKFLTELLQKKSLQKSFMDDLLMQSDLLNNEGIDVKIREEIKILENEVFQKIKILSQYEIKKISDQYLLQKMDLNNYYIEKLNILKDFVKDNWKMNVYLLQVLQKCITSVEEIQSLKKELYSLLNEYERNLSNDITNLELRNQRFKEVLMQQNQHPLIVALKNVMNVEKNPENSEEAFRNIHELILHAKDDSNFITHNFRSDLQSSIKMFFNSTLCGPTSQLMFAPPELVTKFQIGEKIEGKLIQDVKQIANKYVAAKELITGSDRKKLLSWIDILINPKAPVDKPRES